MGLGWADAVAEAVGGVSVFSGAGAVPAIGAGVVGVGVFEAVRIRNPYMTAIESRNARRIRFSI